MLCMAPKVQCSPTLSLLLEQLVQLNVLFMIHDSTTYCTESCFDFAVFTEQSRVREGMSSLDLLLARVVVLHQQRSAAHESNTILLSVEHSLTHIIGGIILLFLGGEAETVEISTSAVRRLCHTLTSVHPPHVGRHPHW
jgi:hypothetical protein